MPTIVIELLSDAHRLATETTRVKNFVWVQGLFELVIFLKDTS